MSGYDWVDDPDLDLRETLRRLAGLLPAREIPAAVVETPEPVLGRVQSVRMSGDDADALRVRAESTGVSVSDLLRRALRVLVDPIEWRCEHMSISTGGAATLVNVEGCRCGGFGPVYR